ncbi:MAG: peptide ABC transporter permease [Ardenticatenaceae bacterium]|nr:MAG: peptide ABC transporter permease [Ardenticatenaceae bacterium]
MIRWRAFFQQRQNWLALLLIGLFVGTAVAAPRIAPPNDPESRVPFKPVGQSFSRLPAPPSEEHPLGTVPQIENLPQFGIAPGQDAFYNWDVFFTLIWGTRSALQFGLVVTGVTAVFGIIIGAISAYLGGWVNRLLMAMTDAFLAFPVLGAIWIIQRTLFTAVFNSFADPTTFRWWETALYELKISPIMLGLILFSWMPYARLINSSIAQLRQAEFVTAARSMGATGPRILFRHLLPNAVAPTIVLMAKDVGGMVIWAAAFIFIGFGGEVAWAIVLVGSRDFALGLGGNPFVYWWTFLPIAAAITLFGLGWNLLGDGLNRAMNPHLR